VVSGPRRRERGLTPAERGDPTRLSHHVTLAAPARGR
jgi:hypothetical protein